MKLAGSHSLELGRDEAWSRLSDLRALGESLPAAEDVEVRGGDSFEAKFRPLTGLGKTPVKMSFQVVEHSAPDRLVVSGSGGIGESAVRLRASFELAPTCQGTEVAWTVELHLYGVIRSLTQRVIGQLAAQQVAAVLEVIQRTSSVAA